MWPTKDDVMRWYDYAVCFTAADFISAGILTGNFFLLFIGIVGYIVYEKVAIIEREVE